MEVEGVYWVGGFGDRAFIGWIPVGVWRGVVLREGDVRRAWEGRGGGRGSGGVGLEGGEVGGMAPEQVLGGEEAEEEL